MVSISPKFQIVIPKAIRERLKLRPRQKVSLVEKDGLIHVVPSRSLKELRGYLEGLSNGDLREKHDRL